jgi:hypothetical protein
MRYSPGATQRAVVDHNGNTVASETDVKLDPVSSNRQRLTKSRHRVFRRNSRRATMTNDQHSVEPQKAQKSTK